MNGSLVQVMGMLYRGTPMPVQQLKRSAVSSTSIHSQASAIFLILTQCLLMSNKFYDFCPAYVWLAYNSHNVDCAEVMTPLLSSISTLRVQSFGEPTTQTTLNAFALLMILFKEASLQWKKFRFDGVRRKPLPVLKA